MEYPRPCAAPANGLLMLALILALGGGAGVAYFTSDGQQVSALAQGTGVTASTDVSVSRRPIAVWTAALDGPHATKRNQAEVRRFQRATGYPKGRKGWIVDHKIPLCAGGPDSVVNMQWQTAADSYRKDVFERALCRDLQAEGLAVVPR